MNKLYGLKKYLEVFRISFKMQIVWRFDVAMTMVATFGRILAAWILWQAVFTGQTSVKGFDFKTMLSYYILGSIISSTDFTHQISREVSEIIRSGKFSGYMVTPVNPLGFFGFMTAGESSFHLGFSVLSAAICAVLFGIKITVSNDPSLIITALAIIPLGLAFMSCYHYFIGVLTFKFMEIGFFMHIQGCIIAFVTGSLVPLSLLPGNLLGVMRYLPFPHVVYTPVMLLCGQAGAEEGLFGIAVLSIWTAAMLAVSQYTYRHLRVKYDGVGI